MCLLVLCVVTKVFAQLQSNSRVAQRRPSTASLSVWHMRHGLLATRAEKPSCRRRFSQCWSPTRPGDGTEEDVYPGNLNIYNFIISSGCSTLEFVLALINFFLPALERCDEGEITIPHEAGFSNRNELT